MKMKGLIAMIASAMIVGMCATANGIVNPSFEDDGEITIFNNEITENGTPTGWSYDISTIFNGKVNSQWSTDGTYSLEISTQESTYYLEDEQATIVQDVNLAGVNLFKFDLKLYSLFYGVEFDWYGSKLRAYVQIDGNDVWVSQSNDTGELLNQEIDVSDFNSISTVILGIRSQQYQTISDAHVSKWDNIRFLGEMPPIPDISTYKPSNTSFEADGFINNILTNEPNGWDVNFVGPFDGFVSGDVATDGNYALTIFAPDDTQFLEGDAAKISQDINMTDYVGVFFDFDIYARFYSTEVQWDPNYCKLGIYIDDTMVWDSNVLSNGTYYNSHIDLSGINGIHTFSLGTQYLKNTNIDDNYYSSYDYLRFYKSGPCFGNGYTAMDLNFDCYVDILDIYALMEYWLADVNDPYIPAYVKQFYDVDPNNKGMIDFVDYANLASHIYDGITTDIRDHDSVDGTLPLEMDVNFDGCDTTDGIVNFIDYAQITGNSADIQTLIKIAEQWLMIAPPNKK